MLNRPVRAGRRKEHTKAPTGVFPPPPQVLIVLSSFQSHRVGQDVLGLRAQCLSLLEPLLKREIPGLGYSVVEKHSPCLCEVLGSVPSTACEETERKGEGAEAGKGEREGGK